MVRQKKTKKFSEVKSILGAKYQIKSIIIFKHFKRLFKIYLEIRLTINRIMESWINAVPDSGNLS